jgi:hypothetical protein
LYDEGNKCYEDDDVLETKFDYLSLQLCIFITEQQNKLVNSELTVFISASKDSNVNTPAVSRTYAESGCARSL